jgi:hypothetical protein
MSFNKTIISNKDLKMIFIGVIINLLGILVITAIWMFGGVFVELYLSEWVMKYIYFPFLLIINGVYLIFLRNKVENTVSNISVLGCVIFEIIFIGLTMVLNFLVGYEANRIVIGYIFSFVLPIIILHQIIKNKGIFFVIYLIQVVVLLGFMYFWYSKIS